MLPRGGMRTVVQHDSFATSFGTSSSVVAASSVDPFDWWLPDPSMLLTSSSLVDTTPDASPPPSTQPTHTQAAHATRESAYAYQRTIHYTVHPPPPQAQAQPVQIASPSPPSVAPSRNNKRKSPPSGDGQVESGSGGNVSAATLRHRETEAERRRAVRERLTLLIHLSGANVPVSNQLAALDATIERVQYLQAQLTHHQQLQQQQPATVVQRVHEKDSLQPTAGLCGTGFDSSLQRVGSSSSFVADASALPSVASLHSRVFLAHPSPRVIATAHGIVDANDAWLALTRYTRADVRAGILTNASIVPAWRVDLCSLLLRSFRHHRPEAIRFVNSWKTAKDDTVFSVDVATAVWSRDDCVGHTLLRETSGSSDVSSTDATVSTADHFGEACTRCGARITHVLFETSSARDSDVRAALRESLRACLRALDADADATDWRTLDVDEFFETQGCYSFDVIEEQPTPEHAITTPTNASVMHKAASNHASSSRPTPFGSLASPDGCMVGVGYAHVGSSPVTVRTRRRIFRQAHSEWVRRMQYYATLALAASAAHTYPAVLTPHHIACYQTATLVL